MTSIQSRAAAAAAAQPKIDTNWSWWNVQLSSFPRHFVCRYKSDSDFPRWQLAGNGVKQLDQPETGGCFFRREDSRESGERSLLPPPGRRFLPDHWFQLRKRSYRKMSFLQVGNVSLYYIGKTLPRLFFDSSNSISLVLARGVRCSSFFFSFLFSYQPFLSCPLWNHTSFVMAVAGRKEGSWGGKLYSTAGSVQERKLATKQLSSGSWVNKKNI